MMTVLYKEYISHFYGHSHSLMYSHSHLIVSLKVIQIK